MYNDELDMALESAYEDGYYQALADMGYEFDDVEEDVDIFDEDCFDNAVEGAARSYRRAQRRNMRESGMSDSEIDAKLRDRRAKNPSYATDPRMRPKRYDQRNMKLYDTADGMEIRKHSEAKKFKQSPKHFLPSKNREEWDKIARARQSQGQPRYTTGGGHMPVTHDQMKVLKAMNKAKMTPRDVDALFDTRK